MIRLQELELVFGQTDGQTNGRMDGQTVVTLENSILDVDEKFNHPKIVSKGVDAIAEIVRVVRREAAILHKQEHCFGSDGIWLA